MGHGLLESGPKVKGKASEGPEDTSVIFQGGGINAHTCDIPNECGEKETQENATLAHDRTQPRHK